MPGEATADELAAAIAESGVGADALGVPLADLGVVRVARDDATIHVGLPVPAGDLRDDLERALRETAADAGVHDPVVAWTPNVPDPGDRIDDLPDVRNVIAVSSGKGGVGKSTVAANVSVALADAGASVGLLDADVHGPNAPALLGLSDDTPRTTRGDRIVPREAHGVRVMSMGFVAGEDDPVIWRGPMVNDVLLQLFDDVEWGALDYLVVDLPPGTGDAQLTLLQYLPVTGAVIVTTPQAVAVDDARRGLRGFRRYDAPVLGVAENMAGFRCPDCGDVHDVFGAGGADALAAEFDCPVLGRLPIDPAVGETEAEPAPPPGVSIPGLGRVGLPRTREERETGGRLPPVALREDGGATREAARSLAARVAAAAARVAVQR